MVKIIPGKKFKAHRVTWFGCRGCLLSNLFTKKFVTPIFFWDINLHSSYSYYLWLTAWYGEKLQKVNLQKRIC